jgi:guanylate kinase
LTAVLLYGPPAAGKDTITCHLTTISERYRHFQRLKVGGGRSKGYRLGAAADLKALRSAGDVVWENERYGATYVTDRPSLRALHRGAIPVVHLGQLAAVAAVAAELDGDAVTVWLWCPRDVAAARIRGRATGDTAARLDAWDSTEPFSAADLVIDTSRVVPARAAVLIHERVKTSSLCDGST